MRSWSVILAGLAIWAAHFFALYAIASLFPGKELARWLALAASAGAIAANGFMIWYLARSTVTDRLDRWVCEIGRIGAAISLVAVTWQSLPAIF